MEGIKKAPGKHILCCLTQDSLFLPLQAKQCMNARVSLLDGTLITKIGMIGMPKYLWAI